MARRISEMERAIGSAASIRFSGNRIGLMSGILNAQHKTRFAQSAVHGAIRPADTATTLVSNTSQTAKNPSGVSAQPMRSPAGSGANRN